MRTRIFGMLMMVIEPYRIRFNHVSESLLDEAALNFGPTWWFRGANRDLEYSLTEVGISIAITF